MEEDILVLQKTLKEKEKECKTKNEQIINLSEQVENLKADLSNIDKNFTMSRESSSQLLESLQLLVKSEDQLQDELQKTQLERDKFSTLLNLEVSKSQKLEKEFENVKNESKKYQKF